MLVAATGGERTQYDLHRICARAPASAARASRRDHGAVPRAETVAARGRAALSVGAASRDRQAASTLRRNRTACRPVLAPGQLGSRALASPRCAAGMLSAHLAFGAAPA